MRALLCLLAGLASPGPTTAEARASELAIEVRAQSGSVPFGESVVLEVERSWPAGLRPNELGSSPWPGLACERLAVSTSEHAGGWRERSRWRVAAYELETLRIGSLRLEAYPSDGGPPSSAQSAPLVIAVRSSLPPGEPGPPELPSGPLGEARARWPWLAVLGLVLAWSLGRRFAHGRRAPAAPPPPEPDAAAQEAEQRRLWLERWQSLLEREPAGRPALAEWHAELRELLRGGLELSRGWSARARTAPELLALASSERTLGADQRAALAELLELGDAILFARARAGAVERAGALALAQRILPIERWRGEPRSAA